MSQEPEFDPVMVALFGDIELDCPEEDREAVRAASAWLLTYWKSLDSKTTASIRLIITSARVGSYLKAVRNTEARLKEKSHD